MRILNPKKIFQSEDSRFLLGTGLKFVLCFVAVSFFLYYILWVIVSLNGVYYESYGIGQSSEVREAYTDILLNVVISEVPTYMTFIIALFFCGIYFGKILMRPFEIISDYSLKRTEGEKIEYNPDIFSDYKLLTRFSEYFFRYIDESEKQKVLTPAVIPPHFSRIHKPPFERVFFFHFILLITILILITSFVMFYLMSEMTSQILEIALQTLSIQDTTLLHFLSNQAFLFESMIWLSCFLIIVSYLSLAFHLYGKVSGAIFAFFSTMRAFMKGNNKARVHLIGYGQVRPHGRAFNKYLDSVERVCSKDKNEVK